MPGGGGSLLGGWKLVNPFTKGTFAIDFDRMKLWMAGFGAAQTVNVYEYDLPAMGEDLDFNLWPAVSPSSVIPAWWPVVGASGGQQYLNGLVWWGGQLWATARVFYAQNDEILDPLKLYAQDGTIITLSNLTTQKFSGFIKTGPGLDPLIGCGGYVSGQGSQSGPSIGNLSNAILLQYGWPDLPGAGDPPANWNLRAPRAPNYMPVNGVDSWVAWNPRVVDGVLEGRWASDAIYGGGLKLANGINFWPWMGTGILDYATQAPGFAASGQLRSYVYRYDSLAYTFIDFTELPELGIGPILGQELDGDGNFYLCHGNQWISELYYVDPVIRVYSAPGSGGGGGGGGSEGPGGTDPPTNISAGTAIVVTDLPYTNEQDIADGVSSYAVWYKYTGVLGQLAIQVKAENTNPGGSTFVPSITMYEADGTTEIIPPDSVTPVQIGTLVATDYYIKIDSDVPDVITSPLKITITTNPTAPIVASYVLITDDGQSGYDGLLPGVIINSNTGQVSNIVFPLAQGDYGDILPNGILALEDFDSHEIRFYEPDFDEITTVSLSATGFIRIRANNSLGVFAVTVRQSGVTKFKIYDDTGTELSTDSTSLISNPVAIALANDGTTMIFALQGLTSKVQTWNLTTNLVGPDLVAGILNYRIADILVLDNDEFLVLYYSQGTGSPNFFVKRYDSAGAFIQLYDPAEISQIPNGAIPRMGYDANGGQDAFWLWWFPTNGTAQADKYLIVDGSVDKTFQIDTYEEGVSAVPSPDNFGPSNSCPIIILGTNNEVESNDDGTLFVNEDEAPPIVPNADGIYEMIPNKTNDTIWINVVDGTTQDVAIP